MGRAFADDRAVPLDESPKDPCSHTRVRFWNPEGQELRFVDLRSFGEMWWVPPGEPLESVMTGLKRLGPEPFSTAFTPQYLQGKLKGSSRAIKTALLDQALVAGVGNIYADESLFMSRIAPEERAGTLKPKQLERLHEALVEVNKHWAAGPPSVTSVTRPARMGTTAMQPGSTGAPENPAASAGHQFDVTVGGRSSHCAPPARWEDL